ncbi:hypothetical protein OIU77_011648 [Salix suchowensis]|uniref:Uncharacterized protein n=1 Tax=Salix suchowensis TaxID=1278906 RepID=A0ABQ9A0Z7_9ROSI|nr:hypothetical protein OIU77_011648 [Salix suchowensis]KAJ6351368.1 hypothetical protein OIU78_007309 [Salix suchowensis]
MRCPESCRQRRRGVLPGGEPWSGKYGVGGDVRGGARVPPAAKGEIKPWSARTKACRLAATLFELLHEALGLKPEPRRDGLCERTCSPESLLPGMPVARVDYEHQQAF